MSGRSRGEPPKTFINKQYPFQVVLFLTDELRIRLLEVVADEHRLGAYRQHGEGRPDGRNGSRPGGMTTHSHDAEQNAAGAV